MKIIFTGDLFLGGDLINNNIIKLVESSSFEGADLRIVNLEQSISDSDYVADKSTLYTGSKTLKHLKKMNISAVNLAHNHIQDSGDIGILETLKHLEREDIPNFGVGSNIKEAKKPLWISDDLCIISYCDFDRPYLKQVRVANEDEPGVNPLIYAGIIEDLNNLPEGKKAILYFHWGREHVWLPPQHDIHLAKSLLEDERVVHIIGMHAHRIQGFIEHNGKRAYMCLGNFLFPNFFITAPIQICYPEYVPEKYSITKQYHQVFRLTYKKWRLVNRVSLMVEYDTLNGSIRHIPVIQSDDEPKVTELTGNWRKLVLLLVSFLSTIYKFPNFFYFILEKLNSKVFYFLWRTQIKIFYLKQNGVKWFVAKAIKTIKKKLYN